MSDEPKRPVDLASIYGPIEINAGPAGPIRVPIRTAGFLSWFEAAERRQRWADGDAFVRALLAEQARYGHPERADQPLEADLIGQFDAEAVEAIAHKMLMAIGPSLIRAGERQQGPAETETVPVAETVNAPSEPATARLLAMVRDYYEHHRAATKRIAERFLKDDSLATIRRALKLTSPIQQELDHIHSASRLFREAGAASRFLAERPLASQLQGLASSEFFDQQKRIADQIAAITAPMQKLVPSLALAERFQPMLSPALRDAILGNQLAWAKTVNAGFDLRLSDRLFADIGHIQSASATAAASVAAILAQTRFDRFGFQATANLALEGLIAPGAAADVLQRYAEASTLHGATFDAVLEAIRSLDDDDDPSENAEAAAERAWHRILTRLSENRKDFSRQSWIELATLLLAVIGVIFAAASYAEQRRSDSSPVLKQIQTELRAIREETVAARASDAEADRTLRYVHATVNLRAEPSRGGMVIRLVYPDQLVKLVDTRGEWARVEVFDYASETPLIGWISRRHLRVRPAS